MNSVKKIFLFLLVAAAVFVVAPQISYAGEQDPPLTYKTHEGDKTIEGTAYTNLSSYDKFPTLFGASDGDYIYVVDQDITLNDRLIINGDVKLILKDNTTFKCEGITVEEGSKLTIYSQSFGDSFSAQGKLFADGGQDGAGIGSTHGKTCGTIVVEGGVIDANGGVDGAGIGGGKNSSGGSLTVYNGIVYGKGGKNGGAGIGSGPYDKYDPYTNTKTMNVTVEGGEVQGISFDLGAGIGGGNNADCGIIRINGGKVVGICGTNIDGKGAGIGGGAGGYGGSVVITGGEVTAHGAFQAAGIGGGAGGNGGVVTIRGGIVKATGGRGGRGTDHYKSFEGGAGIGGGAGGNGGKVTISDGEVTAEAYHGGAGIGGGRGGHNDSITISGGKVDAYAGDATRGGGAAIGGGFKGDSYFIIISGGEVTARVEGFFDIGDFYSAGAAIGSGDKGHSHSISISGGTVTATATASAAYSAAIGGGRNGYFDIINISGGTVTAHALQGAAIGSGAGADKLYDDVTAQINISGGTINASTSEDHKHPTLGPAIGSGMTGPNADGGPVDILISGGDITAKVVNVNDTAPGDTSPAIGAGHNNKMGGIKITGGRIYAERAKMASISVDPIGYWNDENDLMALTSILLEYPDAMIRNARGQGTNQAATLTQYGGERRYALVENLSSWVEIKPCDHPEAKYTILSAGEEGKHKYSCKYCLSDDVSKEHQHEFDENNKCACGYCRYALTFTDGEENGRSKTVYIYPDVTDGKVVPDKEIKLSDYAPEYVTAGKKFVEWILDKDDYKTYTGNETVKMNSDMTFIAQWVNLEGVTVVLSSIDGPVDQLNLENADPNSTLNDLYSANKKDIEDLAAKHSGYMFGGPILGSKPMTSCSSLYEFNDLKNIREISVSSLEDGIVYVVMYKKINNVKVDISAPKCGTVVTTNSSDEEPYNTQNNSPTVETADASYSTNGNQRWLKNAGDATARIGTINITGDQKCYFKVCLYAAYGYTFDLPDKVTIEKNDEVTWTEDPKISGDAIPLYGSIVAVHDFGDWRTVSEPTCCKMGEKHRSCISCDGYESEDIPIDYNAHEWGYPTYDWNDDLTHVDARVVCKHDCGTVDAAAADTTRSVVSEATCTKPARVRYTASFKNEVFTTQSRFRNEGEPDPDAHDWGKPTYQWAEDNSSVTATHVCDNDSNHVETEKAAATSVIVEADCNNPKTTTWTSEAFGNTAFEQQSKEEQTGEALGHDFGDWTELNEKQHQRVCSRDASHVEKANHKWDSGVVTKEPTVDEEGEKTYTCNDCDATKTEPIDKLEPEPTPEPTPAVVTGAPTISTVGLTNKKTMTVTWPKVSGAKSYKLAYRKVGSGWKYINTGGLRYVVKGHKLNGLYEYKVAAVSPTGAEKWSEPSYRYMKTVKAKAKRGKRKIKVSWKKVKGVSGYEIRLSTSKSMKNPKIVKVSAKKKSYTFKKLKKGKRYYVKVRPLKNYKGITYIGVLCGRKSAKAK